MLRNSDFKTPFLARYILNPLSLRQTFQFLIIERQFILQKQKQSSD